MSETTSPKPARASFSGPTPRSILRNAPAPEAYHSPGQGDIDRNEVLENTRANAQLNSVGNSLRTRSSSHGSRRGSRSSADGTSDVINPETGEHLKWDEANLYLTEQEKGATMKITEPKTPFQGAVGESEYYLPDEEDEKVRTSDNTVLNVDELDGFSLGEPEVAPSSFAENERIVVDENANNDEEEEEEEEEETPEEKHRRFEEMRKAHYHVKGDVLHHPVLPSEDDDDEDGE